MFVCPECGASQPFATRCATDGAELVQVGEDLLLGTTIGAYRVARLIGIGGMGRVYKGVHPQIGSRVAIKVLSRECSDRRELVDRFFAEARAVNVVNHESIVNVLDLATLPDGRPYIVMEYLDGAPLAAIIDQARQRGPLPLGGIARLAAEVLDALSAAHAKGVIHRDLKPDNIFVTQGGRPKVLDFGIAKLQPELGGSVTHTGSLMGTPHYMSPEQAAGRPVDQRADLYAMGVILFECCTLQQPFTADSLFDLLRKHVEAPPPSPRVLRPDMPPDLEHVIFTALAKRPEDRFSTAQAMSVALQSATAGLPQEQWTPITPSPRATSNGWAPTPPSSWAGSQRVQPMQPTVTAGQATATAGHVAAPRRKSSLWIALAAFVVVGGGITAAVVAGSSSPAPVAHVDPPAPVPPPPPAPEPIAPVADDGDAEVDSTIAELLDQMPADARAALPPGLKAALAKYGTWAKVPAAERAKLAVELTRVVSALAGTAGADINDALAGGAGHATGGNWLAAHQVNLPGFDAKHAKLDALLANAIAEARKTAPDAELTWISADGVYPDGHADLSLPSFASSTGTIDLRFISMSHAKRDPHVPRGVPQQLQCAFHITLEPDGGELRAMLADDCKEKPIPKPRCTLAAVWKKALAKRKDLGDAVAQITYTTNIVSLKIVWMFDVRDNGEAVFSEQFPDDC